MLTASTKVTSHLRRFYNGEPGCWPKAKENFVYALRIEKCADYVLPKIPPIAGPHNFPVQVMADALIEDQFIELRTDVSGAAVEAQINMQIDQIWEDYDRAFNEIWEMDLNGPEREREKFRISQERTMRIAKVRDNRLGIQSILMADLNRYEKLKTIHDDKVASCLKVFTCCLGPECHYVCMRLR